MLDLLTENKPYEDEIKQSPPAVRDFCSKAGIII